MNKLKIVSYIKKPNKFIKTNFYLNEEFIGTTNNHRYSKNNLNRFILKTFVFNIKADNITIYQLFNFNKKGLLSLFNNRYIIKNAEGDNIIDYYGNGSMIVYNNQLVEPLSSLPFDIISNNIPKLDRIYIEIGNYMLFKNLNNINPKSILDIDDINMIVYDKENKRIIYEISEDIIISYDYFRQELCSFTPYIWNNDLDNIIFSQFSANGFKSLGAYEFNNNIIVCYQGGENEK